MTTTFNWAAPGETIQTALSTELDALGAGNTALSAEISNETNLYEYIDLELTLASVNFSAATGLIVEVRFVTALDGSNFEDGTAGTPGTISAKVPDVIIPLRQVSAAQVVNVVNIPLPALDFKIHVKNGVSAAFAANTNTLKYRRHNEKGV
jgi:hypothetical protein